MMDSYVRRLTKELKSYSRDLYAERSPNGGVQIYRKTTRYESYDFDGKTLTVAIPQAQLIVCLTDDWTMKGNPVEWGIEPVCWKIRSIDSHRDDSYFEKMLELREQSEKNKKRELSNNMKAIAADMRQDFAKATNDIVVRH